MPDQAHSGQKLPRMISFISKHQKSFVGQSCAGFAIMNHKLYDIADNASYLVSKSKPMTWHYM